MTIRLLPVRTLRRSTARMEMCAPKPRLRLRLRVKLCRFGLDRQLADGRPADASEARALRAHQLEDPALRRKLAGSLRHTVADAQRPRPIGFSSTVPMRREAVVGCGEALLGLADRLEHPARVSAAAVARILVLLTDGTGPLYNPACRRSLDEAIWDVADADQGGHEAGAAGDDDPRTR
jgi:hypothetical protein